MHGDVHQSASPINMGHTIVAIHQFTLPLTKKSFGVQPCPAGVSDFMPDFLISG